MSCGKMLPVEGDWLACPACRKNKRLMRITPKTEGHNIVAYCRACKREIKIDVIRDESQ
ncbi:MAG: hypothetical protein IJP43_07660 [Oscillospiraceae bacterium]|nr:hypothetical protein [Oscillospiraceae bacterium]